ncbi:hypothetical protein ACFW3D_41985, partial [Streptomyces sp. NPDC058864]
MPTDLIKHGRRTLVAAGLAVLTLAGCGSPHGAQRPAPPVTAPGSARQMLDILRTVLPEGTLSEQHGPGPAGATGGPPSAQVVFTRGGRAARLTVTVNRYALPVPEQFATCPDSAYHPYSRCTRARLPGGALLTQDRSPADEKHPSGAEVLTTLLTHEDGSQVFVSQGPGPSGTAAAGRTALPLTAEELAAVARSPAWKPVLPATTVPRAAPQDSSLVPRMTGLQIADTIAGLLPPGLRTAQRGGSLGFGHLTADDGDGKGLVAVNVQQWKPGNPTLDQLFHDARTLTDGTRVGVRTAPSAHGGAGAVEWTVDTLRTDGLRVVITAVNAPAYLLPATRPEPVLTTRQLQRIALAPAS